MYGPDTLNRNVNTARYVFNPWNELLRDKWKWKEKKVEEDIAYTFSHQVLISYARLWVSSGFW